MSSFEYFKTVGKQQMETEIIPFFAEDQLKQKSPRSKNAEYCQIYRKHQQNKQGIEAYRLKDKERKAEVSFYIFRWHQNN